jgi:hypothetical protein
LEGAYFQFVSVAQPSQMPGRGKAEQKPGMQVSPKYSQFLTWVLVASKKSSPFYTHFFR